MSHPEQRQSLRLIQFTDTHLFGDPRATLRGVDTRTTLQRVLEHATRMLESADAILVTGDLVQDDPDGYATFTSLFGGLGKPVWCLPGNHDVPDVMRRALIGRPFQVCGHIDRNAWRIVLLDSFLEGSAGGHVAAGELRRLDAALASAADHAVLVCVHHQPVPMRSRWLDSVGLDNAAELLQVIDRHPDVVRGVLWGHVHQAYDGERRGVRLMATPSTCAQFLPGSDDFAIDERPPAYRLIELGPRGQIETETVWLT